MRDFLIALFVLAGGFGALQLVLRKSGTEEKDEVDHRPHPDRVAYEAEVAKAGHDHLSAADAAEVAEFEAFVEEIGTGEFPALAFLADPLGAPIPEDHTYASPVDFHEVWAGKLSLFVWPTTPAALAPLSSVQVPDPDPFELESFTGSWTAADVARMVAEAKAEASR